MIWSDQMISNSLWRWVSEKDKMKVNFLCICGENNVKDNIKTFNVYHSLNNWNLWFVEFIITIWVFHIFGKIILFITYVKTPQSVKLTKIIIISRRCYFSILVSHVVHPSRMPWNTRKPYPPCHMNNFHCTTALYPNCTHFDYII